MSTGAVAGGPGGALQGLGTGPHAADVVLAIAHAHGDPAGSYHVTRFVGQHAEERD